MTADGNRLSFREKAGYGLGDMASNFYMGFFGLFLLYYYTDVFGLDPAAAATMLLVTKIVDAISDPVMGLIADRTNTRWGKYRPYLLWMAIPYALLGYLLFLGPDFSAGGKLAYAYLTYTLVMLAYTAINVPYSALLAVISPSEAQRTQATQFRFVFASLGTLCVGAFTTPLVRLLGDGDEVTGFRLTIVLFAVLSVLLFWITFASTRERVVPPPHDSSIRQDFKALLKNRSWIVLVIASILIVVGLVARFASIVYYMKYYMQDDGELVFLIFDRTAILTSCGLLGQLFGALLTPLATRYFQKHHLLVGVNVIHVLLLLLCFIVPPDQFVLAVVVHSLGIMTFGFVITLLFSMYTDCAEYGRWKFGIHSAGLVVSASMFALKFGSAVGGAIPGYILAYCGFVANEAQPDNVLAAIRGMFCLVPAGFFLSAAIVMVFYQIDRATLRTLELELSRA